MEFTAFAVAASGGMNVVHLNIHSLHQNSESYSMDSKRWACLLEHRAGYLYSAISIRRRLLLLFIVHSFCRSQCNSHYLLETYGKAVNVNGMEMEMLAW